MYTSWPGRRDAGSGFTLIELIVTISCAALAAALLSPHVKTLSRGQEAGAAARELLLTMRRAHWAAVLSGERTRVATFPDRGGAAARSIVETEAGGRWVPEGEIHRIPEGVRLTVTGSPQKVFNPNGTCTMGSLHLQGAGGRRYRLALNPLTGRVRIYRGDREIGREG
jgi:prepilin-type N-terminal cleavage/methylation domain-containing protein